MKNYFVSLRTGSKDVSDSSIAYINLLAPTTVSCLYSFNFLVKLLETVSNFASELRTLEKTSGRTMHPYSSKFEVKRLNKSSMYLDWAITPSVG